MDKDLKQLVTFMTQHPKIGDRLNLEWCVYELYQNELISIGKVKELLGFRALNEAKDWVDSYFKQAGINHG